MSSSPIFEPLNFGFISEPKNYWSTHFYAVLQCLHYQKNFSNLPYNLRTYPIWSLSHLRGTMQTNFFYNIRGQVRNHGFEYFLTALLNQKIGYEVAKRLISELSNIYGTNFGIEHEQYAFYMTGWDSTLNTGLSDHFHTVIPWGTQDEINAVLNRADICLIATNLATNRKTAIFGEVEGNHGSKLVKSSYWAKKHRLSTFSIGVINGKQKQCYVFIQNYEDAPRVHIQFENSHFVVQDFDTTLDFFQFIFNAGPFAPYPYPDDDFGFFACMIRDNWETPIEALLMKISAHMNYGDLLRNGNGDITTVVDLQSS